MKRRCGTFLAMLAVALVGCGGGDRSAGNGATTTKPSPPAILVHLRRQIQAAGIGGVHVFYAGSARARTEATEIVRLMRKHPRNGSAYVRGRIVAWTANQNGLTDEERAEFEEVTKIMGSLP